MVNKNQNQSEQPKNNNPNSIQTFNLQQQQRNRSSVQPKRNSSLSSATMQSNNSSSTYPNPRSRSKNFNINDLHQSSTSSSSHSSGSNSDSDSSGSNSGSTNSSSRPKSNPRSTSSLNPSDFLIRSNSPNSNALEDHLLLLSSPTSSAKLLSGSKDPLTKLRLVESRKQRFLRHGFDSQDITGEYREALTRPHSVYWDDSPCRRIKPSDIVKIPFWAQPPKHRTACAALFLCLRLGYDPPDVVKTSPAPRLEAWTDPKVLPKETVLETIGKRLQDQFEALAPTHARVKFKTYADVYAEEFKKTLIGLRKYSKSDRCLIYYNGHGVPKPTATGEIWVFNKAYTQYIPISVCDILGWVGPPVIFIWDCNNAGHILNSVVAAGKKKDEEIAHELELNQQAQTREERSGQLHASINDWKSNGPNSTNPINVSESQQNVPPSSGRTSPSMGKRSPNLFQTHSPIKYSDTIQLAACKPDEMLPLDPNLPADVFTSCLTSPIEMALRFYVLRNNSKSSKWTSTFEFFEDLSKLEKVPGRMEMRRTPLGELTWIFTSIADAIAWNHLDRQLFTKIFRGDLVLAGTFRGFLLAERVMKSYGCTPMSIPQLPPTRHSELWQFWDLEVDMCLSQLLEIWKSEAASAQYESEKGSRLPNSLPPPIATYKPSTFFSQQLTAFELWLKTVVAENPDENGERDDDRLRRKETLQWSCNDWSGIKINQIANTDFSCAEPDLHTAKRTHSSPNLNGNLTRLSTKSPDGRPQTPQNRKNRQASAANIGTAAPTNPPLEPPKPQRPIRYQLPTYIKHFPLNSRRGDDFYPPSPPQLPIVLQVLLSPLHRLRALRLLCRLMDLGPWTVHLSLSIGIFQYVLKLLQAPAAELKPVLIFIWARILTVYPDGRQDLFRFHVNRQNAPPDAPIEYFIKIMAPHSVELSSVIAVDHKAMCAFILSIGCKNSRANSKRLMQFGVLEIVMHRIKDLVPWQKQWYLVLIAHMWEESDAVKGRAIKMGINTVLCELLTDKVPEVRAAALYAFGTLIGVSTNPSQIEIQDDFPDGQNSANSHQEFNQKQPQNSGVSQSSETHLPCQLSISPYQSNKLNSLSSSNPVVTGLSYQEQVLIEVGSAMACCHCAGDGSPMFRQELVVVLSALVDQHLGHFIVASFEVCKQKERESYMDLIDLIRKRRNRKRRWPTSGEGGASGGSRRRGATITHQFKKEEIESEDQEDGHEDDEMDDNGLDEMENVLTDRATKLEKLIGKLKADEEIHPQESLRAYLWMECSTIYTVLLDLCLDPSPPVSEMAKSVVDYIHSRLLDSVLGTKLGIDQLIEEDDDKDLEVDNNGSEEVGQSCGRSNYHNNHHNQLNLDKIPSALVHSVKYRKDGVGNLQSSRSTTSVFNTVNNLVPNFVKSSGWKTPFNVLSRSPEQSIHTTADDHGSPGRSTSPGKSGGIRRSASMAPISNGGVGGFNTGAKLRVPLNRMNSSTESSTNSSDHNQNHNQSTSRNDSSSKRRRYLLSNRSLESIILDTRSSDHLRRQASRSYKFIPNPLCFFPSCSLSPNKNSTLTNSTTLTSTASKTITNLPMRTFGDVENPEKSRTDDHERISNNHGEEEEEGGGYQSSIELDYNNNRLEDDYLIYLGLHDVEELKRELKPHQDSNKDFCEAEEMDQNDDNEGRRKTSNRSSNTNDSYRVLPLRSNYYELSSHSFLKSKMNNSSIFGEDEEVDQNLSSSFHNSNNINNSNSNSSNNNNRSKETVTTPAIKRGGVVVGGSTTVEEDHHHGNENNKSKSNSGGGIESIKSDWRKQRNLKIVIESQCLNSFDHGLKLLDLNKLELNWKNPDRSSPITNLVFHQFENHLISSDLAGYITVFDPEVKSPLNRFRNSVDRPTRITSLQLMNESDIALVLAGTADGNVRIYKHYDRPDSTEVVTAFKALPNTEPSTYSDSGLIVDWQQSTGLLIAGGNSREIKVWNSKKESIIESIKTRSSSCLASLSTEKVLGNLIFGGFGDGSIRIYDRRLSQKSAMVKVYKKFHLSWLNFLKIQNGGPRELISGDTIGDLAQWDLRLDEPIKIFNVEKNGMSCMNLHDHLPVLATGSNEGKVKVWEILNLNNNNETLNSNENVNEEGVEVFKNRIEKVLTINPNHSNSSSSSNNSHNFEEKPVTALNFHSWKSRLGVGNGDGSVQIYSNQK